MPGSRRSSSIASSAVLRLDRLVAFAAEEAAGEIADQRLVLHHEHALAASPRRGLRRRPGEPLAALLHLGQVDPEGASLARLAVDPDVAVALLHDAVGRREAESGAVADRLGGEERLEDLGLGRRIHAAAGVAHRHEHVRSRTHHSSGMPVAVVAAQHHRRGLDREAAALRHGVTRVEREVDDHLLELRAVGLHPAELGGEAQHELAVLAHQPAEHRLHVHEHRVELEHLRLEELPAGVGEQLPADVGGAVGGAGDLAHVLLAGVVVRHAAREEGAEPEDHRHHVVDFVRHAAGHPADRLHALRLPQVLLDPHPLGEIAQDERAGQHPSALGIADAEGAALDVHRLAGSRVAQPPVEGPGLPRGDARQHFALDRRARLRVPEIGYARPARRATRR